MNWKHVNLIFKREMTDQLRDRRTLFTITILPLLLYPLIGMLMMQIAQFNREQAVRIRLIGQDNWPSDFPLLDSDGKLVSLPGLEPTQQLVEFEIAEETSTKNLIDQARLALTLEEVDAVLIVEPEFETRLHSRLRLNDQQATDSTNASHAANAANDAQSNGRDGAGSGGAGSESSGSSNGQARDGLKIVANLAQDNSQIALRRVEAILDDWQERWAAKQLSAAGLSSRLLQPITLEQIDTAATDVRRAMLWSKILPFVMLVWALTGAFYPAIDLCAGEKERGTLETLLSSPARRREIVWGKLGAIFVFSVGSALLNLMSMHLTASMIVKQLSAHGSVQVAEALGPLPFHAFGWLLLLLLPMAAFFSALALAVAALARSTKEGQYYLMPLLLVTLPLVALPMIPSLELNLGTSLVPVSGAIFLIRSLIEARYTEAVIHLPVVLLVTAGCCALSIRWAITQFESESVLFRESDRWNLRAWLHHLWRDRGETASSTEAVLCGAVIMVGMFFAQFVAGSTINSWPAIVKSTVTVQVGLILTPCMLMAIFLTTSARAAFRLHRPQFSHLAAAVLIGISMHPSYLILGSGIERIYEVGDETALVLEYFQKMVTAQPLWAVLLLLALLPAVCEELAFRGFIFGGLLRRGSPLRAIIVSALFFGFMHTLLQQSIAASLMGMVLGLIAWRTGGVLCTIIVHAINNTLSLTLAWCSRRDLQVPSSLQWAVVDQGDHWTYEPAWITLSVMLTAGLLIVLFLRDRQTQQLVQAELA